MVGGQDGRAQVDRFLRGADALEGLVEIDAGRGLAAGGARVFADSYGKEGRVVLGKVIVERRDSV